jgi:short-subunit dehydrogenase
MQFKNKTALITGASSGLGYIFARKLALEGSDVIITARRSDRLEELAIAIREDIGRQVHVIQCDLSIPGSAKKLFDEVSALNIDVDILINNAGFGYKGDFLEADENIYRDMIQVNVTALTELTYLFLPGMKARKSGGIINVASMAGITSIPYFSVYAATKAYVLNMTEALWKELDGSGVHITAVCPGPTATEFFEVSGYNPQNLAARGIQSVDDVVDSALSSLSQNKPFAPTSRILSLLSKFSSFVPRKLSLIILEKSMK